MPDSFDGSQNIGACIVVVFGRLVLMGRRKNAYRAGSYGLPGGRLEVGEPVESCVRRELMEETGLRASSVEPVGVIREWQGSYDFIHFVYICREWSGEPETKEPEKCERWEWIDAENMPDAVLPSHRAAVRLARIGKFRLVDLPKH